MPQEYYSLPLAVDRLMLRQKHPRCTLQQSVAQNLHLLLTTAFGEFPGDEQFGCSIWDNDFDNITSAPKQKEQMRQSIKLSVQRYEKRLDKVRIELMMQQEELPDFNGKRIKKRIDVTVTGTLKLTDDKFTRKYSFFVGPLSY
jgi:phage baseplate assembly protein W